MLCISEYDWLGNKKLLLLKDSILDSILKAFIKSFVNNNICRNTIQGFIVVYRSLERVCNILLKRKQIY